MEFAKHTNRIDGMTVGGQVILQDQYSYADNIFDLTTVNPFIAMPLSLITFNQVLLNENQIYVTEYAKSISLTTASAATHLPTSIF